MVRIAPPPPEIMSAAQRGLYDEVMAQRGRVRGPFNVLLHAPELGSAMGNLVEHFHQETRVEMRLKELAILVIARHYTAQYEWLVHEPRARRAGVGGGVIEALRRRQAPDFDDEEEAAVTHAMAQEILEQGGVTDETYARATRVFDEPALVELVVHIGFYISVAVLLTTFQVDVPADEELPLEP